jgi:hypothetical protein
MSQEKIDRLREYLVSLVCWLGENHVEVLEEFNKYHQDKIKIRKEIE